jgi:DNA-binding Xre family transcriptional regulator
MLKAERGHITLNNVRINARFVKQMLLDRDIDQRGLARISGISEPTITRLLHGKPFTSDTLARLAGALECHPIDLIDAKGFSSPHMDAPAIANIRQ